MLDRPSRLPLHASSCVHGVNLSSHLVTSPCVTQHARTKAVSTLLSSPARSPHGVDNKGTSAVWLRNDLGSGISGAVVILTRTNSCERPWCGSWNRHQLLGERHAALDPDAMEFAITILLCGSSKCSSLDPVGWPLREPGEVSPADYESGEHGWLGGIWL